MTAVVMDKNTLCIVFPCKLLKS